MTTVLMGTNRFVDVDVLIGLRNRALLKIGASPLRVTLRCPPEFPPEQRVDIVDNQIKSEEPNVVVKEGNDIVLVYLEHRLLVTAAQIDEDMIHVKIDLRPVGINIYDDLDGLHIAGNCFSKNTMENVGTGINLG